MCNVVKILLPALIATDRLAFFQGFEVIAIVATSTIDEASARTHVLIITISYEVSTASPRCDWFTAWVPLSERAIKSVTKV